MKNEYMYKVYKRHLIPYNRSDIHRNLNLDLYSRLEIQMSTKIISLIVNIRIRVYKKSNKEDLQLNLSTQLSLKVLWGMVQ